MHTRRLRFLALSALVALAGCSRTDVFGATSTVVLTPAEASVEAGRSVRFTATTTPAGAALVWSLTPETGSIDATGIYTAPLVLPGEAHRTVTVRAALQDDAARFAEATVRLVPGTSSPPARLEKLSGDEQTGVVGEPLPEPLVVRVVDAEGRGVPGILVRFRSPAGASFELSSVSDAEGRAQAAPQTDVVAGRQTFPAQSAGLDDLTFELAVAPGPLAQLAATHPDPRGTTRTVLAEPVLVTFLDRFNNPIPGLTATAEVPDDAFATPREPRSNAAGEQEFTIRLASTAGLQRFVFRSGELTDDVDFAVTGGPAARIGIVGGDGQEGIVGQALAEPLRVRLLDANGAPAGSGSLTWTTPDGGTLEAAATTPDLEGFAEARLVLPTRPGAVRVVVDAGNILGSPVTFHLRATAGPAQRLQLVAGGGQTTTAGQPFGGAFSVRATDALQNPVSGVTVAFSAIAGGGAITPATVVTGADGLAQATMTAGVAGPQKFRAAVDGLTGSPLDVTNTAVALTNLHLELVSGDNQTGVVGTDLSRGLVVRVRRGTNPAAGVTVTFAVAQGDGSVRPVTATTAADGTAATSARLGQQAGTHRFSANVPGADNSPVYFVATATARQVTTLRLVSGGGQTAAAGSTLAPFVVQAVDAQNQPVDGANITFEAPAGAGITPASSTAAADGTATATATLGPVAGEQVFRARSGAASIEIGAIATSTQGARILVVSGDNQRAEVGLELPQELVVRVLDAQGAPRANAQVRWRAEAELATVSAGATNTDTSGEARIRARLGRPVGTQRFFAETNDVMNSPATFTATATAAPAEKLVVAAGDGQSALVGTALPRPLVVRAVDRVGNAIAGVTVNFRAGTGGGLASPARGTTDASGEVSTNATLGRTVGPQTFVAEATGLQAATFTAIGTNQVDRLSVTPQGQQLEVGGSVRYVAVAIYTDGSSGVVTEQATWTSANGAVLAVNDAAGAKGVGRALAAGATTVTATFGGKSGSTPVTVVAATLQRIVVLPAVPELVRGSTRPFSATGNYSNGSAVTLTETATWTSSNPAVATVSDAAGSKGLVRATGVGTAVISATALGVTGTRTVTVSQAPLRQLEISPANVVLPAGSGQNFRATATYEDGTVEDVTQVATWSSSDETMLTVQNAPAQAGRATFIAAGTPQVRATWAGVTASQQVTITQATVVNLAMLPDSMDLSVRDFFQFRVLATYSDGTVTEASRLATWSSSAPAVADVSNAPGSQGVVTALAAGRATITARIGTATATARVDVSSTGLIGLRVMVEGGRNGNRCPKGALLRVRAGALYQNGQPADISDQASWVSSDPTVAVVGQGAIAGGVVQCLKEGRTNITATWAGFNDSTEIIVTAATIASIEIAPTSVQLARGDTRELFATATYTDGTRREITNLGTWTSSNGAVASVTNAQGERGRVTGLGAGTTQVSIELDGVVASATVTVTNAQLVAVVISPANPTPRLRERFQQFNATALYDDGSTQDVTQQAAWATTDPSVARVSNDANFVGVVVLERAGSCQVLATYAGRTGRTTLTVRQ